MIISKMLLIPTLCAAMAFGTASEAMAAGKKHAPKKHKAVAASKVAAKPAAKSVAKKAPVAASKSVKAPGKKVAFAPASHPVKHAAKKHHKVAAKHA